MSEVQSLIQKGALFNLTISKIDGIDSPLHMVIMNKKLATGMFEQNGTI